MVAGSIMHYRLTLLYVVAIGGLLIGWNGAFPLDDSYIVLHSARALLAGNVDQAYAVTPLTGATSSVHLALVAALGAVLPLPVASITINALAALAYALGLDALARRAGAEGWKVPALVVLGFITDTTVINLFNGLETGLAMATVAWLLTLADDRRLPVLAGLAPFVRPELAVLSGLLLLRSVWLHGQAPKAAALALASAAPWAAWMWAETGSIIPATANAKLAFYAESRLPLELKLRASAGAIYNSGLVPIYAGLIGIARPKAGWCGAAFIASILLLATLTLPSSLAWNYHRYLAVTIPVAIFGLASFAGDRTGPWAYALLAAFSVPGTYGAITELRQARADYAQTLAAMDTMMNRLPPRAVILTHDAGMIAWTRPAAHIIDVVGLKTPSSIAFHQRFTSEGCQWGQALDHIARAGKADHALVQEVPFWSCVRTNLMQVGWRFELIGRAGKYGLYRISPPTAKSGADR